MPRPRHSWRITYWFSSRTRTYCEMQIPLATLYRWLAFVFVPGTRRMVQSSFIYPSRIANSTFYRRSRSYYRLSRARVAVQEFVRQKLSVLTEGPRSTLHLPYWTSGSTGFARDNWKFRLPSCVSGHIPKVDR